MKQSKHQLQSDPWEIDRGSDSERRMLSFFYRSKEPSPELVVLRILKKRKREDELRPM